ncbi:protein containing tetratricopeptide (TPR) repeat [Psychromonas ingrahamii 37]|uniref:Lipoprotein NlpI n=1 Tax=Psychromonas ingrahamii (strain DSM 17664 / CCUG 51855 / 37) TaxID=357804 RepID=A1SWT6_PSYIN|nr:lipoprotein NlpI [Psychromonas ingrahamii]ABM03951.1 protein containing tetratricopeptide (TPR) repeat [Psychromonas ingrahamii 37]
MRFHCSLLFVLPILFTLTACQSLPNTEQDFSTQNNVINKFPLSTAVQIDYQDEVKLLKINQLLVEQKDLDARQYAVLFYERGVIYDRMGLAAHSRYDFIQALSVDPTFADAYNFLGLYLLLSESYDEAFDAFDSALELSDNMQYSYLHRAVGLYQIGRYQLAMNDIEKFYSLDQNDPYRVLWRFIINSKVDQLKALQTLKSSTQLSNDPRFAWAIVDVIAGRTTEKDFLESLSYGVNTNKELAERLCEAYFYLAHWHQLSGHLEKAVYYFKLSTATNIHEFIEYKYALIELGAIQRRLQTGKDKK